MPFLFLPQGPMGPRGPPGPSGAPVSTSCMSQTAHELCAPADTIQPGHRRLRLKPPNCIVLDPLVPFCFPLNVFDNENNQCGPHKKTETDNCLHRGGLLENNM